MKKFIVFIAALAIAVASCFGQALYPGRYVAESEEFYSMLDSAIALPDENAKIKIKVGDSFYYSHETWGSVGYSFYADYNESAFDMQEKTKGVNPMMCGGDEGTTTCLFKALKKGRYTIKIVHTYRGTAKRTIKYKITVK